MIKSQGSYNGVPWRSHEITRIEALSDAVFAFAVTLLVVSLEVPQTFTELWEKMHGLIAFAISFSLLFQVWYTQHTFFRRYGMQDAATLILNAILLFLVLFYMYPLKFLFLLLSNEFLGGHGITRLPDGRSVPMLASPAEANTLMIIYGIGFAAVFAIFVLLYHNVFRRRKELGLSPVEVFDAQSSVGVNAVMVSIGLASIAVLEVTGSPAWAGMSYVLIPVAQASLGSIRGGKRKRRFGNELLHKSA